MTGNNNKKSVCEAHGDFPVIKRGKGSGKWETVPWRVNEIQKLCSSQMVTRENQWKVFQVPRSNHSLQQNPMYGSKTKIAQQHEHMHPKKASFPSS